MRLQLYQEPVTPTGGQKSEGVQNVLGRPPLNWTTVVLREAVQNSWDARVGSDTVEFEIRWFKPSREQRAAIRDSVFTNEPLGAGLRNAVKDQDFDVVVFSDRGTRGLSGPVLANEEAANGEKRNFVDFVWEIGRSERAGMAGGTYGYGKTSFFRMSRLRAICVHSRCMWQGKPEDRFIAAYLGPSTPKLTGRCWWGEISSNSGSQLLRPLTGPPAAQLAAAVGLPSFPDNECGTSIMMLAPRLYDLSQDDEQPLAAPTRVQVMQHLAESLVQWFWPKMISLSGSNPPMRFSIFEDGKEFPVPSPDSLPPYNTYAEAFRLIPEWRGGGTLPTHAFATGIECGRPRAHLGHLLMLKRARKQRKEGAAQFGETSARELHQQSHHVVLLRKPMLVVRYLKCARPPVDQMDYAGVFVVDSTQQADEVEQAFALSEPPTHDDWVPETLEGKHKTFVRVALRKIKEAFNEFAAPVSVAGTQDPQQALGAFSEMLGDLIAGSTQGTGARIQHQRPGKSGGGGSSTKKSRVEFDGDPRIETIDGKRCLSVPFRVFPARNASNVNVQAVPVILLEQGQEREPPADAPAPRVHSFCWVRNGKPETVPGTGSSISIPTARANTQWLARIELPADIRVRLDLRVIPHGD
jgi:hypothetical protein